MPEPSQLHVFDARVPMRDGVELAADVVVDDEPRPVMLIRTPYSRAGARTGHDAVGMARRGWAVVVQDVRGRFESGGDFRPFHQEIADGFDTIAWCAEQPWSDGRVVMTGMSYNGATQWLAALDRPPALKAISPSVITPDLLDGFAYEGGAFQQGFLSAWAIMLAATGSDPSIAAKAVEVFGELPGLLEREDGRVVISELFPDYGSWVPLQQDYWGPVNVVARMQELDVPAWRMAGWYDLFCEGTLAGYMRMADHASGAQRLIVGPWTHIGMNQQSTAEMDFGVAASGATYAAEMEAFLRAELDGSDTTNGVTVFVMGSNTWQDLVSWPPPATSLRLYLGVDGSLSAAPPDAGQTSWLHDPTDPVPTRGGRTLQGGLPGPGPVDQRPNESRPDVLVWTGDPLEEDLTVIGLITAEFEVRSSATTYDVVVTVSDVHPDGRSLNVVDSVRRTVGEPGTSQVVSVDVGSTAMTFRRGHRIRVALCASNYPRFDLLPAAEHTVHLGRSTVCLPVTGDNGHA